MLHYFEEKDGSLLFRENGESVMVTPWGANSFRVRAAFLGEIEEGSVALSAPQDPAQEGSIRIEEQRVHHQWEDPRVTYRESLGEGAADHFL